MMIIVWDFDRTIIDGDCDRWVVLEMGLTDLFHQLRLKFSWNQLMDKMMEELHSLGKTVNDFITRLNCFKMDPQMISAIRSAHDLGCEMNVLSNANQFFIETILKNNGIYDLFSEIITNPTVVNQDGRLRIFPYHGVDLPPHGCKLCPANLCKGSVIERIHDSDVKKRGIIYIGDGKDDLCPSLKLRDGDHVMARNNFILYHMLSRATIPISPKLHYWKDGQELNNMLIQLLSPQVDV